MKGHEALLQMRLNGKAPEYVFINDFPCKTDWMLFDEEVTINVDGDALKTLDLRMLVDLKIIAISTNLERAKTLFAVCKKHHPQALYCSHINGIHHTDGWMGSYSRN